MFGMTYLPSLSFLLGCQNIICPSTLIHEIIYGKRSNLIGPGQLQRIAGQEHIRVEDILL